MTTETLTEVPDRADFEQIMNDLMYPALSGAIQVSGRTGNRWRLVLTYTNLLGTRRRTMFGHAMQLKGMRNRLTFPMSLIGYARSGGGGGSPQLNGSHSAGATSLSIDNASINITNYLMAGDWISVGNELKIVTQSASTTGGGAIAALQIWPELHQARADNVAVEITAPVGVFLLAEPVSLPLTPAVGDWLADQLVLSLEEDVLA